MAFNVSSSTWCTWAVRHCLRRLASSGIKPSVPTQRREPRLPRVHGLTLQICHCCTVSETVTGLVFADNTAALFSYAEDEKKDCTE